MNEKQQIILVNERDEQVGTGEKMKVHREGLMHRAFSVFIFDREGRMLLQQRAAEKYHGGLLWTNACCSHPYPDEDTRSAALRRLQEELGFTTELKKIFEFSYYAEVGDGLIEHEYDHVFAGEWAQEICPNKEEVRDFAYRSIPEIKVEMGLHPEQFTSWFRIALPRVEEWWSDAYGAQGAAIPSRR